MQRTIALIGVSGFVGRSLLLDMLEQSSPAFDKIVGISRSEVKVDDPRFEWRKADLFSLLEIEKALEGVDIAIYLVHSMLPTAKLDQGSFQDYDLLLADNFLRSAQKNQIQKVIYLSGIIPTENTNGDNKLSQHLKSRHEVEELICRGHYQHIVLRAGLIMAPEGSSFIVVKNLVERLRVMLLPNWTRLPTSPVSLCDTLAIINKEIQSTSTNSQSFDIGINPITYMQLLKTTAQKLGLKRSFIPLPVNFLQLSKLWVRMISGVSSKLLYPLIDSLTYQMTINQKRLYPHNYQGLAESLSAGSNTKTIQTLSSHKKINLVRSVQRHLVPSEMDCEALAQEYMDWLPKQMFPIVKVNRDNDLVSFNFLSKKISLLILRYSHDREVENRRLFYIEGGLLLNKKVIHSPQGRLEFRLTYDNRYLITAIHDFVPALPWPIYRLTQAIVHLWVMKRFTQHLKKLTTKIRNTP